jgi:hypothetical protein
VWNKNSLPVIEHFGTTPAAAVAGWIPLIPYPQRTSQFIYCGYCFGGSWQLYRAVALNFWVELAKILY